MSLELTDLQIQPKKLTKGSKLILPQKSEDCNWAILKPRTNFEDVNIVIRPNQTFIEKLT